MGYLDPKSSIFHFLFATHIYIYILYFKPRPLDCDFVVALSFLSRSQFFGVGCRNSSSHRPLQEKKNSSSHYAPTVASGVDVTFSSCDVYKTQHTFPQCLWQVFEVDQALVLRVKNALLSKAPAEECSAEGGDDGVGQAEVIAVEADLSQAGWEGELFEAGFDPTRPSAWILEGLTM